MRRGDEVPKQRALVDIRHGGAFDGARADQKAHDASLLVAGPKVLTGGPVEARLLNGRFGYEREWGEGLGGHGRRWRDGSGANPEGGSEGSAAPAAVIVPQAMARYSRAPKQITMKNTTGSRTDPHANAANPPRRIANTIPTRSAIPVAMRSGKKKWSAARSNLPPSIGNTGIMLKAAMTMFTNSA